MSVLVASVQRMLSGRVGGMMSAAGLDGSVASPAFLEPIASSARELYVTLADPTTVVDADLAAITQDQVSQLVDVAELRALESALYNYAKVNQSISLGRQDLGDLRKDLEALVTRKAKYVEKRYGIGRGSLASGTVTLDFSEPLINTWSNVIGISDP